MASIQTRGKTIYVVWRGIDADGAPKQIWSRCDNKKQANLLKAKIEASSEKSAPSDKTLRELITDYIEIYGKAKWAPKTYTNRLALLDNYVLPYICVVACYNGKDSTTTQRATGCGTSSNG